jgi:hypothetical protein
MSISLPPELSKKSAVAISLLRHPTTTNCLACLDRHLPPDPRPGHWVLTQFANRGGSQKTRAPFALFLLGHGAATLLSVA